jgi:hypothetical protein
LLIDLQHIQQHIQFKTGVSGWTRINAWKVMMGRNLKVTYREEGDSITVITAMQKGAKQ